MDKVHPILAVQTEEDITRIDVQHVIDDDIPEELNGESGFHIVHVRMLTQLLLEDLKENGVFNLTDEEITAISVASSLHDIGKTRIPKSILDYPGKLSPGQYDIVKKHAAFGEEIINEAVCDDVDAATLRFAAEIARSHHERIDGTGYPDGLKGDAVPLAAQVVSLADSYDALTSLRSYKQAFSQDVAMQMLSSGMCGVFSEKLLDALLRVVNHNELVALRETANRNRVVVAPKEMMAKRVLCLGNTGYLTKTFIEDAFFECKVTVVGNLPLEPSEDLELFHKRKSSVKALFDAYDFDVVVYFSKGLTYGSNSRSDAEELRATLECAAKKKNVRVLYLGSQEPALVPADDHSILEATKEQLCTYYASTHELDVKVLRLPYLYSAANRDDFLYRAFQKIHKGEPLCFAESASAQTRFLSMRDLSELLTRVLDNWQKGGGVLTVCDDAVYTFEQLAQAFAALPPKAHCVFENRAKERKVDISGKALRDEYGWFPKMSLMAELPDEYERFLALENMADHTLWQRVRNWLKKHALAVKITELVLLFLLTECLLHLTDSAVIFSIVDFRMAYIVIMGTVHGLQFGIAAASLSGISWLVAKVMSGTGLLTVFYEPTNWLAFVLFFLVGALCGYIKLRNDDKIRFTTEQNAMLEDELGDTRKRYERIFQERQDLKKQIISSKDSFGKIFDITKKLNTVDPRELYLRVVDTFEEILDCKSVSVYSMAEGGAFGRLEVASHDIFHHVARSVSVDSFAPVVRELENGNIWRNVEEIPDLPMYAEGVYNDGRLVLMIFLWQVSEEQKTLYYTNLFKILCDLVEMALLRAYEYSTIAENDWYIEGTHILLADEFDERVEVFAATAERKIGTYVLLEIDCKGRSMQEAYALLSPLIRTSDILGASKNGTVRLLLSQATEKDLEVILPRFEALDVEVRRI